MQPVFVDTVAWIALINASDALHTEAGHRLQTLRQQRVKLVTTEFVLMEVADALSAPGVRAHTIAFVDGIRTSPVVHILPADHDLLVEAWALYSGRPDKNWGLTDCTSFVAMTQHQIDQAFTADRHFEQAGFTCLLKSN